MDLLSSNDDDSHIVTDAAVSTNRYSNAGSNSPANNHYYHSPQSSVASSVVPNEYRLYSKYKYTNNNRGAVIGNDEDDDLLYSPSVLFHVDSVDEDDDDSNQQQQHFPYISSVNHQQTPPPQQPKVVHPMRPYDDQQPCSVISSTSSGSSSSDGIITSLTDFSSPLPTTTLSMKSNFVFNKRNPVSNCLAAVVCTPSPALRSPPYLQRRSSFVVSNNNNNSSKNDGVNSCGNSQGETTTTLLFNGKRSLQKHSRPRYDYHQHRRHHSSPGGMIFQLDLSLSLEMSPSCSNVLSSSPQRQKSIVTVADYSCNTDEVEVTLLKSPTSQASNTTDDFSSSTNPSFDDESRSSTPFGKLSNNDDRQCNRRHVFSVFDTQVPSINAGAVSSTVKTSAITPLTPTVRRNETNATTVNDNNTIRHDATFLSQLVSLPQTPVRPNFCGLLVRDDYCWKDTATPCCVSTPSSLNNVTSPTDCGSNTHERIIISSFEKQTHCRFFNPCLLDTSIIDEHHFQEANDDGSKDNSDTNSNKENTNERQTSGSCQRRAVFNLQHRREKLENLRRDLHPFLATENCVPPCHQHQYPMIKKVQSFSQANLKGFASQKYVAAKPSQSYLSGISTASALDAVWECGAMDMYCSNTSDYAKVVHVSPKKKMQNDDEDVYDSDPEDYYHRSNVVERGRSLHCTRRNKSSSNLQTEGQSNSNNDPFHCLLNGRITLLEHANGRSTPVHLWIERGQQLPNQTILPKLCWKEASQSQHYHLSSNQLLDVSSIELLEINRIRPVTANSISELHSHDEGTSTGRYNDKYPFSVPSRSFVIKTNENKFAASNTASAKSLHVFQASSTAHRDECIQSIKNVVSTLATALVTGDIVLADQFFAGSSYNYYSNGSDDSASDGGDNSTTQQDYCTPGNAPEPPQVLQRRSFL